MNIQTTIKNNIWLVILLALIISFIFPRPGLIFSPMTGYLLMILMFISCLDLNFGQLTKQIQNWKKQILILAIIHLLAPILILIFAKPFFSPDIYLGLILTASMPSGMSVVFLSCLYCEKKDKSEIGKIFNRIFNFIIHPQNEVAPQALFTTTISNLLSPIIVPLVVLALANTVVKINFWPISLTIVKFAIIPVFLAKGFTNTKIKNKIKQYGSEASIILLFLIMLGIISPTRSLILENIILSLWIAVFLLVIILIDFSAGYLLGKTREEKITLGITASYKNFTLASVIALSLFSPVVALPAIIYAVVNNFFLIPLQYFVKKR